MSLIKGNFKTMIEMEWGILLMKQMDSIKVKLAMEKNMDLEVMWIVKELNMKDNGKMIKNLGMEE